MEVCASHGHMSLGYGMEVDALCGCGLSCCVMSHQSAEENKLAMKKKPEKEKEKHMLICASVPVRCSALKDTTKNTD